MEQPRFAPIVQFGTSRFLQAHVDLFVSQALEQGAAIGKIAVVQTTDSPGSTARIKALASGDPYPVRIQGLQEGLPVDILCWSSSVQQAVHAASQWSLLRQAFVRDIQVVISNTGDQGYCLDDADNAHLLASDARAPISFPAKLLVLLHGRWQANPDEPVSLFPCELVARNGDILRNIVVELAVAWRLDEAFCDYLRGQCRWANSLVDRIVSQALEPVGAVAEPYALWAIEQQPGLTLPCTHPAIVITDDLDHHERLKLFILNAGHTYLAERWLLDKRDADETVYQAMNATALRKDLEAMWREEVLPVFAALGQMSSAQAYLETVRDRFLNPFLNHRIADIAGNHSMKKLRRMQPIVELAGQHLADLAQPKLKAALASDC
ncbi:mannitol dehydrogenase family protein [Pseudomonas fluorescens]|uniref:Altronate oxidoreductase n=1 Tax=Pseudomonas fluorescens TaxID=294 RepID=A0A5E7FWS0_PSEFL|nr:mannitol dehydrogenase family protein [Pseudomonas fluorescens]VVO43839.1 Altronate oxidoreductase [Pseudomonas fluorescens]